MKKIFLLLPLVIVSACVDTIQTSEGLAIKLQSNPQKVFEGGTVTVYADVENLGISRITNLVFDVFDTGTFLTKTTVCRNTANLDLQQMKTFECNLRAGNILTQSQTGTISSSAKYDTNLHGSFVVKTISQNEYELRSKTGALKSEPSLFTVKDKNLEMKISLSSQPFIDKAGKKEFMHISFTNIGNGFIDTITFGNSNLVQSGSMIDCPVKNITITGKQFPEITCEITLPGNINYIRDYLVNINVGYSYEVRQSLGIEIIK